MKRELRLSFFSRTNAAKQGVKGGSPCSMWLWGFPTTGIELPSLELWRHCVAEFGTLAALWHNVDVRIRLSVNEYLSRYIGMMPLC